MSQDIKAKKLFISHSSLDEPYVTAFVELLEGINMPVNSILCSSVEPYTIPIGEDIYDWIRDNFLNYDLHVFFILSKNFYNSCACLNEMGAMWLARSNYTNILLPGFGFDDICGCILAQRIGIKLDNRDIKPRLNSLKNNLINEFALDLPNENKWERIRDKFIDEIHSIQEKELQEQSSVGKQKHSIPTENVVDTAKDNTFLRVRDVNHEKDPERAEDVVLEEIVRCNKSLPNVYLFVNDEDSKYKAAYSNLQQALVAVIDTYEKVKTQLSGKSRDVFEEYVALVKQFLALGDNCRKYYTADMNRRWAHTSGVDKVDISEHDRYFKEMQKLFYDFQHNGKGSIEYLRKALGR